LAFDGFFPRRVVTGAVLCGALFFPTFARAAEPVDDATKNAARDLALRAAQAYEAGDHATAQDLFHRAYALVPAPTLSLREARALEKLGRLVEAVEAYVRTTRTRVNPNDPEVFQQSVREAQDELAQLRPRVPRLKIAVEGADTSQLTVTVDGKPLRRELVGVEAPIDPGTHAIEATTANGAGASQSVTLKEGESQSVVLRLEAGQAPVTAPTAEAAGSASTPAAADAGGSRWQRTWAIVSFGVGGAGLGVGVITGLMASSRHSRAEDGCPENRCVAGSPAADDVDAFRSLRTVSTVGYVVAAVGVAAGTTLLLTAPKERESGWVSPYLGPGAAGVTGAF
jgi:hypothetical protein